LYILLPLDSAKIEEASLTSLVDVREWLLLEFDEGRVIKQSLHKSHEEIEELIDVVIVIGNGEYVWPFMEKNIAVLVAPVQRSVEDVLEAFLFKELHELS
jgi:ABC-type Na+ transport system ATPase subunit NatA